MATILVTGGCGFIGAHLCAALRARGDQLRVLDDLSTGSEAKLQPGIQFNLARHRSIPVVYASSAAVHGRGNGHPLHEASPTVPLSSYGADKLGCEQHARVAGLVHGTMGLRFFNVFGPGQNPASPYSGVISIFCDKIRRGQPITMYGDGRQTRDFVHVGDVVRALIAALPRVSTNGPALNVCTGSAVTIQALAEMIAEIKGQPIEIRRQHPRAGEITHSVGSAARAQDVLGWRSSVTLRDGLRMTLDSMAREQPALSPAANA